MLRSHYEVEGLGRRSFTAVPPMPPNALKTVAQVHLLRAEFDARSHVLDRKGTAADDHDVVIADFFVIEVVANAIDLKPFIAELHRGNLLEQFPRWCAESLLAFYTNTSLPKLKTTLYYPYKPYII